MTGKASRDMYIIWQGAVEAIDCRDLSKAMILMSSISDFSSRIMFNVAILHMMKGNYIDADQVSMSF